MGDRYNIHSQLEHLQSKYIGKAFCFKYGANKPVFVDLNCIVFFPLGTGHADTSRWEWVTNIQRDSYASYISHPDLLSYFSIAENESRSRMKFTFLKKMMQPCGPPEERPED